MRSGGKKMSLFQSKNASKMEDGKKEKENKKTRKSVEMGTTTATARSAYEAKVGGQALKRAGGNKNLKGHVFEQMRCDQYNYNPVNIAKGQKKVLAKSTTAVRDDLLTLNKKGKVIGREQLKNVTSKSGMDDLVKRVSHGQYKGTQLVGTNETYQQYGKSTAKKLVNGKKITQKMTNSGITSGETEVIATKALATKGMEGGAKAVAKNAKVLAEQAGQTAKMGGAISAGVEVAKNIKPVMKKEKSLGKAGLDVAKEGMRGAGTAAVAKFTSDAVMLVTAPVLGPGSAGAGMIAGAAAAYAVDKTSRKAENKIKDLYQEAGSTENKANMRPAHGMA